MTRFSSPEALHQFVVETQQALADLDMARAAGELAGVSATAFGSSAEWLGELGAAVRRIEARTVLPIEVEQRLDRILAAVHLVWPTA